MKLWENILICAVFAIGIWGMATPAYSAYGLEETAGEIPTLYNKSGDNPSLVARIGDIIGSLLTLVGVVFFILMLYGGFMWMTARGHEDQASKALRIIFDAIIGMIIVLGSYAITDFVFKNIGIQPVSPTKSLQTDTSQPAGPSGAAPAPTGTKTKCEQYYSEFGLSCNKDSLCKGKTDDYKKAHDKVKQGTYVEGKTYLKNLCPQGTEIVCCSITDDMSPAPKPVVQEPVVNIPLGKECYSTSECVSGAYCKKDSGIASDPGKCESKLEDGKDCKNYSECVSNKCSAGFCGEKYLADGIGCKDAIQCKSGFCSHKSVGVKVCTNGLEGTLCLATAECKSGLVCKGVDVKSNPAQLGKCGQL